MKLLIAGFGDLGSTLAGLCRVTPGWKNASILAIRRTPPEQKPSENVSWIKADLSNLASLSAIAQQASTSTHVVYCAAPSERSEAAYRSTYITGLQNLVAAIAGTEPRPQLLFVSSTAVYNSQAQGRYDETSPTEPRGFNGQVLLQAEHWLMENWPGALIIRLSGIYGPGKQGLLKSLASGTATVPESPDYMANRIHIEDAARAILHLFDRNEQGVFIGTDRHPMPLTDLYQQLAQMLAVPPPSIGAPSAMMGKKQLSNQKLLATGFEFKWPDCLAGYRAIISGQDKNHNQ